MMKTWLVEPRDSVMVRDGRPADLGLTMYSVRFPWPSTTSGFLRTYIGLDPQGRFTLTPADAKKIVVHGPLLIELHDEVHTQALPTFYAPAPQDALWYEEKPSASTAPTGCIRYRLAPNSLTAESMTDLTQSTPLRLLDILATTPPKGKTRTGPAFWRWDDLMSWLQTPPSQPNLLPASGWGLGELIKEHRTHVRIDPATQTAEDGKLFHTEMLRFMQKESGSKRMRQFALALGCEDPRLKEGSGIFGGERRLSKLREIPLSWPVFPKDFRPSGSLLRVVLLTPGLFRQGFRPDDPADATLVAAAVGRPEIISGWDLASGGPKATRRMAPAGSVYWFELHQGVDPVQWAQKYWMRSLCDNAQDQRDGFGLCVVGAA